MECNNGNSDNDVKLLMVFSLYTALGNNGYHFINPSIISPFKSISFLSFFLYNLYLYHTADSFHLVMSFVQFCFLKFIPPDCLDEMLLLLLLLQFLLRLQFLLTTIL